MKVISLGGSLIWKRGAIRTAYIKEFHNIVREYSRKDKICVVVGGGEIARKYVQVGRKLGLDEFLLDYLGIMATRINASLFISEDSYPTVPLNVEEAVKALATHNLVFMGGTEPGHTTDAVALMVAERTKCKEVINLSNVDGIYDKDPRKHRDVKLIEKISYDRALKMALESYTGASTNFVMDPLAIKIAARSKIVIKILNGNDLENFKKALEGKKFYGTTIR